MTSTEKEKVEQEKTALFEAWTKFKGPFIHDHQIEDLIASFSTINYTLLQLSCFAEKVDMQYFFGNELASAIYEIRCMVEFFQAFDNSLKKLQQ